MPSTRKEFWQAKFDCNRQRDAKVQQLLADGGWRFATVWECAIRGPHQLGIAETVSVLESWLPALGVLTCEIRAPRIGAV